MQRAFLLSLGRGIATVLAFALMITMSRALAKADYGVFQKGMTVLQFAGVFLAMGVSSSLYYLLAQSDHRKGELISGGFVILFLTGATFAIALWMGLARELAVFFKSPRVEGVLHVLALIPLCQLVMNIITPVLMTDRRETFLVNLTVAGRVLVFVAAISPLLIGEATPRMIFVGMAIGAGLWVIPLIYLFLRKGNYRPNWPRLRVFRSILVFGLPLWLSAVLVVAFKSMDRFIVGNQETDEVFAVYSNGAFELPFLGILTASVTAVLLADLNRLIKENKKPEAFGVWQRAGVKCGLIVFPIVGGAMLFAPEVVVFLFGEGYRASAEPFRIYLAVLPIRIVSWDVLILGAGQPKVTLLRSALGLVLNLGLSISLYRQLGINGVALGTVLSIYVIHAAVSVPFIRRNYSVSLRGLLPWKQLACIVVASLVATLAAAPSKLLGLPPFWTLSIGGIIFLATYTVGLHRMRLQPAMELFATVRQIGGRLR